MTKRIITKIGVTGGKARCDVILAKNIFISFFFMLILSSCVYRNELLFSVRNLTEDTLIIVTKKIIPEFNVSVNNYEIKSDSESENNIVRYINSSDTSFFVPPFFFFRGEEVLGFA